MARKIQVHQVDAFTRERFTGNPTGVVLNADALSEAQMLAIARELNNAETAFILAPDGTDHTVRARFFTPRAEAGFVGHATVATQYVLSRRFDAPRWQRQKSKAGIVDIEVRGTDAERRIAIRRSPPRIGRAATLTACWGRTSRSCGCSIAAATGCASPASRAHRSTGPGGSRSSSNSRGRRSAASGSAARRCRYSRPRWSSELLERSH